MIYLHSQGLRDNAPPVLLNTLNWCHRGRNPSVYSSARAGVLVVPSVWSSCAGCASPESAMLALQHFASIAIGQANPCF